MEIYSLPDDIIQEILRRVSANSFTDLFNTKKACKPFLKNSESASVYKAIELSKFRGRLDIYHGAEEKFLKMCLSNNNPEALYNMGVQNYFQHNETTEGLRLLKLAADGGYDRAVYVYAMLHQTLGDAENAQNYMSQLTRDVVREVRYRCPQEPGVALEQFLPQAFVEKQVEFDPTAPVSGCYCNDLFFQVFCSTSRGVVLGDNILCDRCFMHLEHSWFLQGFIKNMNYWIA